MRFWDASAIAPLLVEEDASAEMSDLLRADPELAVWWGSAVECTSAIRRREREASLSAAAVRQGLALLRELRASWTEVQPTDAVRAAAERALGVHPLRAADALQLAAALIWADAGGGQPQVVCLDQRLADAAAREGLSVLPDEVA